MKRTKSIRHTRKRSKPAAREIAFSFKGLRQAQIIALHRPEEYVMETPVLLTYHGTPHFIRESIQQGTHAFSLRLRPPHRRPMQFVLRREMLLQILNAAGLKGFQKPIALPKNIRFQCS